MDCKKIPTIKAQWKEVIWEVSQKMAGWRKGGISEKKKKPGRGGRGEDLWG